MKQLLTLVALLAMGTACQNQAINESAVVEDDAAALVVNHRLFTEVTISNIGICGNGSNDDCASQTLLLQKHLMKLNPVPVPDYGQTADITATEATARYKQFIAGSTNLPLLLMAKQLYPRILLNQYGLLVGTDYTSVLYLTRQMAEGNSLDFRTQATALTMLKGHMPVAEFNSLVGMITVQAEKQKKQEDKVIGLLTQLVKNKTDYGGKHTGTMSVSAINDDRNRLIAMMKKADTGTYLAQLYQLQRSAID